MPLPPGTGLKMFHSLYMNRIKDFIYNKNDLLVALVIVFLAAIIITSRVDIIMAYPATIASNIGDESNNATIVDDTKTDVHSPDKDTDKPNEGLADDDPSETVIDKNPEPNEPPTDTNVGLVSIYIEYGSTGSQIAQLLIDSGLIESKDVFYDAVTAAGAETKLQAGNFKIPKDAQPSEIIHIITN